MTIINLLTRITAGLLRFLIKFGRKYEENEDEELTMKTLLPLIMTTKEFCPTKSYGKKRLKYF